MNVGKGWSQPRDRTYTSPSLPSPTSPPLPSPIPFIGIPSADSPGPDGRMGMVETSSRSCHDDEDDDAGRGRAGKIGVELGGGTEVAGMGGVDMETILHRLIRTESLLDALTAHVGRLTSAVDEIRDRERVEGTRRELGMGLVHVAEGRRRRRSSVDVGGGGSGPRGQGESNVGGAVGVELGGGGGCDAGSPTAGSTLSNPPTSNSLFSSQTPSSSLSTKPPAHPNGNEPTISADIANLTTQISALSASVAQLQRLQSHTGRGSVGGGRMIGGDEMNGEFGGIATGGKLAAPLSERDQVAETGRPTRSSPVSDQGAFRVQMPAQGQSGSTAFGLAQARGGQVTTPGAGYAANGGGNGAYLPGMSGNSRQGAGVPSTNNGHAIGGYRGPPTPGVNGGPSSFGGYTSGLVGGPSTSRSRPITGGRGNSANVSSLSMNLSGTGFGLVGQQQPMLSPAQMLLAGLGSPNIASLVNGASAATDWTTSSSPQSIANHQQLASAVMGMTTGPPGLANAAAAVNGMISPGPGGYRDSGPPTPGGTGGGMKDSGGMSVSRWDALPLSQEVLRQISKYGIGPPNKIQARSLPFMLRGSDVIAQAPPTQERIITYVIPIIQLCLNLGLQQAPYSGPNAIIVTTTVDQANQAHKLIRDLGSPLGVRAHLAVGAANADITTDVNAMRQNAVQVVIGTPARVHDVFLKHANGGGLSGAEVRMLVLDEVDQLIARNLYEYVLALVRVLPASRSSSRGPISTPGPRASPYDQGMQSPFNPASSTPFPGHGRAVTAQGGNDPAERQTCIFSNTIPTDVINFSQSIQVREPVRVLVRREGVNSNQNDTSTSGNLRHYYLYLAFAATSSSSINSGGANSTSLGSSSRSDLDGPSPGPGTIGSGRVINNGQAGSGTGASKYSAEVNQAKEWKLDALADLLADYPLWQAIVHVGSTSTLDAVVAKLQSRQMEALPLNADMSPLEKQITLAKWKVSAHTQRGARFLIVLDVVVKAPEMVTSSLVVNFDLPRSVDGYAQRVAAAAQPSSSTFIDQNGPMTPGGNGRRTTSGRERDPSHAPHAHHQQQSQQPSAIINFIQSAGGDVEMLRSIECAYRLRCSETPSFIRDLF